jgi:hypothetical protein
MLALVYTVMPFMILMTYFWDMVVSTNVPEEDTVEVAPHQKEDKGPILYPMFDFTGNLITEEVDISDFNTKEMVKKVSDIVQGQYWVECMQHMEIMNNLDRVLKNY